MSEENGVSLTAALYGRSDVPNLVTASNYIKRGWVDAEGGGKRGNRYLIRKRSLWMIKVLHQLSFYFNYKILRQVSELLYLSESHRALCILRNGKVMELPDDSEECIEFHSKFAPAILFFIPSLKEALL